MPTYEYQCITCKHDFDIIKSISMLDDPEACPKCSSKETERHISRTHFYGASDWDKAQYNPGLGVVTKNAKHAARIAKDRGLIEVGNEPLAKVMQDNEKRRDRDIESNFEESFAPVRHHLTNS